MGHIYDEIKGLITPKMIANAAESLGENESNLKASAAIILPALLGRMIKKGVTPNVISIVDDAGRDKIAGHLPKIFEGHGIVDGKNYGERMENALIGVQNSEFPAAVAAKRGIKAENADRLTNWLSAAVAGYFGKKVIEENKKMTTLVHDLEREKGDLAADIPSDLYSKLGVSSVFGSGDTTKSKDGHGWIWWLIIILVVLILLFFWWRSCNRDKGVAVAEATVTETVVAAGEPDSVRARAAAQQVQNGDQAQNREQTQQTLPDGQTIVFYKDGSEEQIVGFLKSGAYKEASADSLKNTWFEFDNIDFVYNTPDQLTPGSMDQLNNLIVILKNYPDAKIKIGGYADKTGSKLVNEEISKGRAEYVKSLFVKGGIAADRVSTEGFGEEFAKVPEKASNAQRAIDRHIALRFTK